MEDAGRSCRSLGRRRRRSSLCLVTVTATSTWPKVWNVPEDGEFDRCIVRDTVARVGRPVLGKAIAYARQERVNRVVTSSALYVNLQGRLSCILYCHEVTDMLGCLARRLPSMMTLGPLPRRAPRPFPAATLPLRPCLSSRLLGGGR